MEDMRAVLVHENAGVVVVVVGISANMRPLVANEHFLIRAGGKPLRNRCPGETGAYNEVIEHRSPLMDVQDLRGLDGRGGL
jgi:hypothetical protein